MTIEYENKIKQELKESQNVPIDDSGKKNLEQVYEIMGNGPYQYRVVVLFSLVNVVWSIFFMTPGMFFQLPDFFCHGKACEQSDYCKLNSDERSMHPGQFDTITAQFELYCEKDFLNSLGESMPFLGSICGLMLFMYISDNKGRRLAIGISWLIASVGGILVFAFENVVTIFMGLYMVGFGLVPAGTIAMVYLNETTVGKFRSVSICFMYVVFGGAELLIWSFSKITNNWREFNIYFLALPYLCLNCMYFLLYETPKFLHSRSTDKTVKILNKMIKVNGKSYRTNSEELEEVDTTCSKDRQYSYIDLFRYKSLRKISICLLALSFGIHAVYYGTQFSLDLIGTDFAKNTFYVGLADFFGYLLSDYACPRLPRKKWLIFTLFLTSLFCFSFILDPVPDSCLPVTETCVEKGLQIGQAVAARFVISFSFSFMIIWMNELFPTTIRSSGLGLQLLVGLGGAYVIPYIKTLCQQIGINFLFVLGFFGILGCVTSYFVKETFNHPVLDEIPELTKHHQHDLDNDDEQEEEQQVDNQNKEKNMSNGKYIQYVNEIEGYGSSSKSSQSYTN